MDKEKKNRKGYATERRENGEVLLCFRSRSNENKKLDLAVLVVEEMKSNPKFAEYFKKISGKQSAKNNVENYS